MISFENEFRLMNSKDREFENSLSQIRKARSLFLSGKTSEEQLAQEVGEFY